MHVKYKWFIYAQEANQSCKCAKVIYVRFNGKRKLKSDMTVSDMRF